MSALPSPLPTEKGNATSSAASPYYALSSMRKNKGSTLSDDDVLSLAVDSVIKKKMQHQESGAAGENSNPNLSSKKDQVSKKLFDIGLCDAVNGGRNMAPLSTYSASPYLSIPHYGEAERKSKIKTTAKEKDLQSVVQKVIHTEEPNNELSKKSNPYDEHDDDAHHESIGADALDQLPTDDDINLQTEPIFSTSSDSDILKKSIIDHFLDVLNNGSYEKLLELRGIGQVRALRIVTLRNSGLRFEEAADLEEIGMNDYNIHKFFQTNAASML